REQRTGGTDLHKTFPPADIYGCSEVDSRLVLHNRNLLLRQARKAEQYTPLALPRHCLIISRVLPLSCAFFPSAFTVRIPCAPPTLTHSSPTIPLINPPQFHRCDYYRPHRHRGPHPLRGVSGCGPGE